MTCLGTRWANQIMFRRRINALNFKCEISCILLVGTQQVQITFHSYQRQQVGATRKDETKIY